MLFPIIMIAVLHEILLMVILPMLLPLISKDWFPYLTGLHKGQNASKNCELLQDIPYLVELPFVHYALQSKVPMSAITSRMLQYSKCNPMLMPKILLLTRVGSLSKKKKGRLPFVIFSILSSWFSILCHAYSDTIYSKDKILDFTTHPPRFGAKNEIYYSLSLFICHYSLLLFTPNFCLFKGGCPLYLKQVFSWRTSSVLYA